MLNDFFNEIKLLYIILLNGVFIVIISMEMQQVKLCVGIYIMCEWVLSFATILFSYIQLLPVMPTGVLPKFGETQPTF